MSLSKLCKQITTATEKAIQASIEMYINKKFGNLDKGYYELDSTDLHYIQKSKSKSKIFFDRLFYHFATEKNLIQEARKACGYEIDSLHTDEISKGRVFVVTDKALGGITVDKERKIKEEKWKIFAEHEKRLQVISLFANYIAKKQLITEIVVTSKNRFPIDQAGIVYNTVKERIDNPEKFKNIPTSELRYSGNSGNHVIKRVEEGADRDTIIHELKIGIENGLNGKTAEKLYFTGFNHVGNNDNTYDIGAKQGRATREEEFRISFRTFKQEGIYITSQSIEENPVNEPNCHHFVFR